MTEPSSPLTKLVPIQEIGTLLDALRNSGKKIVQCNGCFDLLHPGHVRHFEAAKREGDVLIVTVTSDRYVNEGPGRPVFPQDLRAEFLAALTCVDFVCVNDSPDPEAAIRQVRPDVYVEGGEHLDTSSDTSGNRARLKEAVETNGGHMHFTNELTFSSSALLNRHFDIYPQETQLFLQEFRQRHTTAEILQAIERIRGLKVLLIGEAVIDEYHYVRPMNKPSKANIIATRYLSEETFIGGIFACANHVAGFCDTVHVVTSLGRKDTKEDFIRAHLKANVTTKFFYRDDSPTIVKRRFVDSNFLAKLYEVYYFEDTPLPEETDEAMRAYLDSVLPEYDVVIVLDYAHGLISPKTIDLLSSKARFLAVNTQTNAANIGYNPVVKYPRADLVCIDEPELRLATRDRFGAVEPLLDQVVDRMHASVGIVTRGHKGCLVQPAGRPAVAVPVLSTRVVDAVGAGDAFLAIVAPCVAAGLPTELVGFIGNAVGALAVTIVGNRESVDPVPLYKSIKSLMA